MFEKILLATDFSAYAKKTLECIAGFPGAREIILFHAAEGATSPRGGGEIGDTLFRAEYEHLKEQKRYLEGLDPEIRVTTVITAASDTAGAIINAAEERRVCLIVMGARGSNPMDGILLGSVSMAVIRRSSTTVLIMRHKTIGNLKEQTFELFCQRILCRTLCPVDFSPSSEYILALAGATSAIGEILLLHVVSPDEAGSVTGDAVQRAKGQLATIRDDLAKKNIRARMFLRTGNPATEIIRIADEEDASVIWMSSRGAGWLRELLIGSTAFAVAMNAQRPVMVVRQPNCGGEEPPFSPS